MYKKLLAALFLISGATISLAQSTLTGANFNPQIGDAFVIHNCDTPGVMQGSSGAGQVWNFSALTTTSVDTGRAVSCLSTPNCSSFPGSTLAVIAPPADLTQYFEADSSKLSQVGYYQAADTNLILSNPLDEIRYPFTYPDSFSDTYSGILTYNPITANEVGTVNVTCDGYGILILPGVVDSNVLRVYSTQVFTDSANLFGTPTSETFNINTYTWYKPGYHNALLTISFVSQVDSPTTSYKLVSYSAEQTGVASVPSVASLSTGLQLYPNPAQNELNIGFTNPSNERVHITLTDVLGREVAVITDGFLQGTQQHITCNTTSLPRGLYMLRLQSGAETITRKVVLE